MNKTKPVSKQKKHWMQEPSIKILNAKAPRFESVSKPTQEEMLRKIIEKAVKNGWKTPFHTVSFQLSDKVWGAAVPAILFRHDFAKAFWGENLLCYDCGEPVGPSDTVMGGRVQIGTGNCTCSRQFENNEPAWQYHLQQAVLEEDPIAFCYKFI